MAFRQARLLLSHAQRAVQGYEQRLVAANWSTASSAATQPAAWNVLLAQRRGAFSALRCSYATAAKDAAADAGKAAQNQQEPAAEASSSSSSAEGEEAADAAGPSQAELQALLFSRDEEIGQLKEQLNDLADAYKRNLAEMENLRERTRREIDTAKKFAIQGFVKSLLDVADNMGRALEAVPTQQQQQEASEPMDGERALKLLTGLQEGVQATEKILLQILRQSGVEQFNPLGEAFDPNKHMAMFEVMDPTKEAGTIAIVTKRGYTMHDRVVRAAEVGVVKAPPS